MAHKYYQPTEYEEMMLAAGWLTMADLDDDYQEYCRKAPYVADGETSTYEQWTQAKRDWDELNERYEREIAPYYTGNMHQNPMPDTVMQAQHRMLRDMSHIEIALGY